MPAGDKTVASIVYGQQVIQLNTFMPVAEIIRQCEGPVTEADDPIYAVFEGVNANDQTVTVRLKREKIDGTVISPLVRMAVTPPGRGGLVQ